MGEAARRLLLGEETEALKSLTFQGEALQAQTEKLSAAVRAAGETRSRALLEGNFNLGVAAGRGRIHGGNDLVKMLPDKPPGRASKDNERDFPAGKVLLITHVLIGCQQHVEASPSASLSNCPFEILSHLSILASVTS